MLDAAATNVVLVIPDGDAESETVITLIPAQKQAILARLTPFFVEIKALAVGLP